MTADVAHGIFWLSQDVLVLAVHRDHVRAVVKHHSPGNYLCFGAIAELEDNSEHGRCLIGDHLRDGRREVSTVDTPI
ncbi:hypothetical protein [Kibdelosporangium persicum]|uniref:hypothetical protein n=1 Tax=Kibdelosporangium persicum TaxID=2698649 RepID=UPI001566ED60|nr:hypothetical protein [Kibdelosporangium persicum]